MSNRNHLNTEIIWDLQNMVKQFPENSKEQIVYELIQHVEEFPQSFSYTTVDVIRLVMSNTLTW